MISQVLSVHSGQPVEKILEETQRDRYMSAEEAKAYGLIDEVLQNEPGEKEKSEEKK